MNKHADERGIIDDLLVTEEGAITHITFAKGAVRGNHYHEETIQHDFILKGRLICKTYKAEGDFDCDVPDYEETKVVEVSEGEMITHKPYTQHAYLALVDSEMVSCVYGPRKGEDYASDTFKLDTPLL